MLRIRLVSTLKQVFEWTEKEFNLDQPTPIRELVDVSKFPEDRIIVLINEKGGKLDSLVSNTDEVKLLPVAGGG